MYSHDFVHHFLFICLFVQHIDPQNQAAFIFFLFFKKDLLPCLLAAGNGFDTASYLPLTLDTESVHV